MCMYTGERVEKKEVTKKKESKFLSLFCHFQ